MFSFVKNSLKKVYCQITSALAPLFSATKIDQNDLQELETIFLNADVGIKTIKQILGNLKKETSSGALQNGIQLKDRCTTMLTQILHLPTVADELGAIILLVGVNGAGKTTAVAKLAHMQALQGHRVLLVAADTFRAAAPEQLASWAHTLAVSIHEGVTGQDPAAVVFTACERFVREKFDTIIIDTAGRLHNKVNLMSELAKIKRVIAKVLPGHKSSTLLTIDAMLGQSSFEQAKTFQKETKVDGVILTKADGTAKGGIVFAIATELNMPVQFISFGERPDAFKRFDPKQFVQELLTS